MLRNVEFTWIRLFPSIRTRILHVCITNGWLHDDVTRTCHTRVMHMPLTCLHESFPTTLTLTLLLTMKCSLSTALKTPHILTMWFNELPGMGCAHGTYVANHVVILRSFNLALSAVWSSWEFKWLSIASHGKQMGTVIIYCNNVIIRIANCW